MLATSLALLLWASAPAAAAEPPADPPPPAVTPAGKEATLKLGGLLQAQLEFGDRGDSRWGDGNDRVYLRRARLNASGTFREEFDFRLELDLAGSLGNASGMRAQLTDGSLTWTRYPLAHVRWGQFKTPFGFEQLVSDPLMRTPERSLANDRLTLGRQLGMQTSGAAWKGRASWSIGFFNGTGVNTNANDDDSFLAVARVAGVPWAAEGGTRLSVGLNGFRSEDTAVTLAPDLGLDADPSTPALDSVFAGERRGLGADLQVTVGPLELWVEALRQRLEPDNGIPRPSFEAEGGYVQATYTFPGERLQGVLKAETFDPRSGLGGDDTTTWTGGVNLLLAGHDLKAQAHYLRFDLPDGVREGKLLLRFQAAF